ncbi:zinc finger BED domain-containing protein 1-like [Tetranychus urticae]|uniref:HAT C-terminal dimerisation domain-containing protein n=1 Tax=Tetranychus urticae TaxID=32264 RepID=A0A158P559_TETUR|nr:zinc finger BED domain-containing protein 1-like [Tetranychus urticae]
MKRKSDIWTHFTLDKVNKFGECNTCGKKLKYCGSSTSFWRHASMHGLFNSDDNDEGSNEASDSGQLTIPEVLDLMDESSKKCVKFKDDLCSLIVTCGLPFSVVEKPGFELFFKRNLPRGKLPSRFTIKNDVLKKFEVVKLHLIAKFANVDSFALTFDSWTEPFNNRGYLGVTLHFLLLNQLQSQIIAVKEHKSTHSAHNIVDMLETILCSWNIAKEKIVCCTTDNGANMKLAVDLFLGPKKHVPCFAHTLNLCVKEAIEKSNSFSSIVDKVKAIVTFIKHSSTASQILAQAQTDEVQKLKLKQAVVTRWNSIYLMLERFVKLNVHVYAILTQFSRAPGMVNQTEITAIVEALELLKPFYEATEELSSDTKTTISKIIPMVNLIDKRLSSFDCSSEITRKLKQELLKAFNNRFGNIESSKLHAMATILDPRFKRNDFQSIIKATEAVNLINRELSSIQRNNLNDFDLDEPHHEGLWSLRNIRQSEFTQNGYPLDESFRLYLNNKLSNLHDCPITIWLNLKQLNSSLSDLALKYLIIPATSVPSERVFSKAGHLVGKERSSLDPKLVEEDYY